VHDDGCIDYGPLPGALAQFTQVTVHHLEQNAVDMPLAFQQARKFEDGGFGLGDAI